MNRRLRIAAAVLIAIAAVGAGTYAFAWRAKHRFNSATWIAEGACEADSSARQQMVDDLLRSRRLEGLTREGVELMLGPGDTTSYFAGYDLVYRLGIERQSYFKIDSEWLVIQFDPATGLVASAKIATD